MLGRQQSFRSPYLWAVAIASIGAILLRLRGLTRSMWEDEWSTMQRLQMGIGDMVYSDPSSIFYNILIRFWGRFEDPIWYLRLFSVLLSVYAIVFTFLWLRKKSKLAALSSILLMGYVPMYVFLSQDMRWYSLLVFCGVSSLIFADIASDRKQKHRDKWLIWFGVSVIATALSHPVGLIWSLTLVLHWFQMEMQRSERTLRRSNSRALVVGIVALMLCTQVILVAGFVVKSSWWPSWWPRWIHPVETSKIKWILAEGFGVQNLSTWLRVPFALVMMAWFGALCRFGNFAKNWSYLFMAGSYLVLVLLFSVAISPILLLRTTLPFWTCLIFFAVLQIASMEKPIRLKATAALALISIIFVSLQLLSPRPPRGQWKQVAERIVNTFTPPYVVVEIGHAGGFLSYYLPGAKTIDLAQPDYAQEMIANPSFFVSAIQSVPDNVLREVGREYRMQVINASHPFVAQFWRGSSRRMRIEDPAWRSARESLASSTAAKQTK